MVMRSIAMLVFTGAALALVFGCESQKAASVKPAPQMIGLSRINGKGIPNGRSDTNDGYTPLSRVAADPGYGFEADNPVKIGGAFRHGSNREQAYLNGLRGPAGQPIEYERVGSCCPFETRNSAFGSGLLDTFQLTYEGQTAPATIYINIYDEGLPMVPVGFTPRQPGQ
jgi:hypothetical protein